MITKMESVFFILPAHRIYIFISPMHHNPKIRYLISHYQLRPHQCICEIWQLMPHISLDFIEVHWPFKCPCPLSGQIFAILLPLQPVWRDLLWSSTQSFSVFATLNNLVPSANLATSQVSLNSRSFMNKLQGIDPRQYRSFVNPAHYIPLMWALSIHSFSLLPVTILQEDLSSSHNYQICSGVF